METSPGVLKNIQSPSSPVIKKSANKHIMRTRYAAFGINVNLGHVNRETSVLTYISWLLGSSSVLTCHYSCACEATYTLEEALRMMLTEYASCCYAAATLLLRGRTDVTLLWRQQQNHYVAFPVSALHTAHVSTPTLFTLILLPSFLHPAIRVSDCGSAGQWDGKYSDCFWRK